jgi:EF hand
VFDFQSFFHAINFLLIILLHFVTFVIALFFHLNLIDEADRDGDGEISEDEFLRIMKKTSLY